MKGQRGLAWSFGVRRLRRLGFESCPLFLSTSSLGRVGSYYVDLKIHNPRHATIDLAAMSDPPVATRARGWPPCSSAPVERRPHHRQSARLGIASGGEQVCDGLNLVVPMPLRSHFLSRLSRLSRLSSRPPITMT